MLVLLASIVSVCIGLLSSHYAQKRGRDASAWFVLGVLLGVFALILLFILPQVQQTIRTAASSQGDKALSALPLSMPVTNAAVEGVATQSEGAEHGLSESGAALLAKDWHYIDVNGKQEGPCHYGDLKLAVQREAVNAQSFVWTEGMTDWKRASEIPDLSSDLWPNS